VPCCAQIVGLSIVFAFGFIFVLTMMSAYETSWQMAQHAKQRRLRYVATGESCSCTVLTDPQAFHLFLSHAWPAAQDRMRIVKARFLECLPSCRVFLDVDGAYCGNCFAPSCNAVLSSQCWSRIRRRTAAQIRRPSRR
jgi:hypothetical protein